MSFAAQARRKLHTRDHYSRKLRLSPLVIRFSFVCQFGVSPEVVRERTRFPFQDMKDRKEDPDVYWTRSGSESVGIVVVTTWMLCKPRQFQGYSGLYSSLNWDSLISHPNVVNLWFPNLAMALAIRILDKLYQELQERPRPIVFATFSGGLKACLYKIFQILDASGDGVDPDLKKYRIIRAWYGGQIHDSSPVDFVSENGANFISHPVIRGTDKRNAILTWSARAAGKLLEFLLLPTFEAQRADMWTILEKSAAWGPFLIICSKDDDLAPFEVIKSFGSQLSSLGCKVRLIVFEESTHVAHLRRHPEKYTAAVESLLSDAEAAFSLKVAALDAEHNSHSSVSGGHFINGTVMRSTTSGWILSGRKASSDGRTKLWLPSRI